MLPALKNAALLFCNEIQDLSQFWEFVQTDDIDIDRQSFGLIKVQQQARATLENEVQSRLFEPPGQLKREQAFFQQQRLPDSQISANRP